MYHLPSQCENSSQPLLGRKPLTKFRGGQRYTGGFLETKGAITCIPIAITDRLRSHIAITKINPSLFLECGRCPITSSPKSVFVMAKTAQDCRFKIKV